MMHPHPKPDEDKAGQARGKPISEFNPAELRDKIEALSREVVELASVKTRRIAELETELRRTEDARNAADQHDRAACKLLAASEKEARGLHLRLGDLGAERDELRATVEQLTATRDDVAAKLASAELELESERGNYREMRSERNRYREWARKAQDRVSAFEANDERRQRWVHVKRQTHYWEQCRAKVQAATRPIEEGDTVIIYVGNDGEFHARRDEEFEDGRFITLDTWMDQNAGKTPVVELPQSVMGALMDAGRVLGDILDGSRPVKALDAEAAFNVVNAAIEATGAPNLFGSRPRRAGRATVRPIDDADEDDTAMVERIADGLRKMTELDEAGASNPPDMANAFYEAAKRGDVKVIVVDTLSSHLSTGSGVPGDGEEEPERFASGGFVELQPLPLVGETPSPAVVPSRWGGHICMFGEAAAVIDTAGAILKVKAGDPGELVLAAGEHVLIQEADGSMPLARVYLAAVHNRALALQVFGVEAAGIRDARASKFDPEVWGYRFELVTSDELAVHDQDKRPLALLAIVDVLKHTAILKVKDPATLITSPLPERGRWQSRIIAPGAEGNEFPDQVKPGEVTPPAVLEALDPGPSVEEAGAFSATDAERMVPRYRGEPSELYGDAGPDGAL